MRSAPNYTTAALIMGWVNLMWIFMVLWATFGFSAVLLAGFALNKAISWIEHRA